ncbi:hypothetical protein [Plesiomonas sp.]|uniref:hypothetical protein n=1 Tax=Plesiomonas sp. TaxID=2486279 RepID=UPI003F2DE8AA
MQRKTGLIIKGKRLRGKGCCQKENTGFLLEAEKDRKSDSRWQAGDKTGNTTCYPSIVTLIGFNQWFIIKYE